ncbi:GlxA family transcriptional regulator [Atopomonas sediminilitoris]|uniref:GlxA family transcriptional regulator n=1 Tax=Atopomonas sediminilitoris TaxID=2919919 RepID=UPI001FD895D4|nr:helix-turn-helix domain-containing protein [Atopomonas sediminilitoris]
MHIALWVSPHTLSASISLVLDALQLANQCAGKRLFTWRRVSIDGHPVPLDWCQMAVEGDLNSARDADLLLIPAIGSHTQAVIAQEQALLAWLRANPAQPPLRASLCSGAFLLAAAGQLDGHRATTHWRLARRFAAQFPAVELCPQALFCADGQRFSSGGAQAMLDLCLHLIAREGGSALAQQVADLLVFDYGRGSQQRFDQLLPATAHQHPVLALAQQHLQQHYASALDLAALAAICHCSPRTLLRHFRQHLQMTPSAYQQRLRVAAAQSLLRQGQQSLEHIAATVGYQERASLAKVFKQLTGQTPAQYRRRAAP